jgi:hypothetical protein
MASTGVVGCKAAESGGQVTYSNFYKGYLYALTILNVA